MSRTLGLSTPPKKKKSFSLEICVARQFSLQYSWPCTNMELSGRREYFSSIFRCLFACHFLRPFPLRIPHTGTVINIFHDDFSGRRERDKNSVFLPFVNQSEAASPHPPLTPHHHHHHPTLPPLTLQENVNRISGCFTVGLIISSCWWLLLI